MAGKLNTSVLSTRVVNGKAQWQEWHHDFAVNQAPVAVADDVMLQEMVAALDNELETIVPNPQQTALQVKLEPPLPSLQGQRCPTGTVVWHIL